MSVICYEMIIAETCYDYYSSLQLQGAGVPYAIHGHLSLFTKGQAAHAMPAQLAGTVSSVMLQSLQAGLT